MGKSIFVVMVVIVVTAFLASLHQDDKFTKGALLNWLYGDFEERAASKYMSKEELNRAVRDKEIKEVNSLLEAQPFLEFWNEYISMSTFNSKEAIKVVDFVNSGFTVQFEAIDTSSLTYSWKSWYYHHLAKLYIMSGDLNGELFSLIKAEEALLKSEKALDMFLEGDKSVENAAYVQDYEIKLNISRDLMWTYALLSLSSDINNTNSYSKKATDLMKSIYRECGNLEGIKNTKVLSGLGCPVASANRAKS